MPDLHDGISRIARTVILVKGIVQGVGFRPFVYQAAIAKNLNGHVINTTSGVEIDVEGPAAGIDSLVEEIRLSAPPLSHIIDIETISMEPSGRSGFRIGDSIAGREGHQLVSPDTCTCDDCIAELLNPQDRRYRYPFINCTNCGPRFTIIEELPYDRHLTTMNRFVMCPECQSEYEDPGDRRFHAEPNACPECGPQLWLADSNGNTVPAEDAIRATASALRAGKIVALKGLGGFQLACLATSEETVERLRLRKRRPHKPFALMTVSVAEASLRCHISPQERELLESAQRPVVLLRRLDNSDIADAVAPGLDHLGVMLPCTPMHFLLLDEVQTPLVMTSGNLSDEPICRTSYEAMARLSAIADLFLMHDRKIKSTYDDSVMMVENGRPVMLRRARGYAPLPVKLPAPTNTDEITEERKKNTSIFAAGAELKNTFCLTRGTDAFLSQHMGDLENVETLLHYERTESLYESLFNIKPEYFVCDSHPDYLSTAYCQERQASPLRVQHHKAHLASCLAENNVSGDVVGVTLDGTGFGDDGTIWGGEFFAGGLTTGFTRVSHLELMPLLGGDAAVREPWRTALAAIWKYAPGKLDFASDILQIPERKRGLLQRQLQARLNCPMTSSCGRLFDAVGALVLRRLNVSYEAQAAIELEALAWRSDIQTPGLEPYRFMLDSDVEPWILSPAMVVNDVICDIERGTVPALIALRFHLGLSEAIVQTSVSIAEKYGLDKVALSGGVFQNRMLLRLTRDALSLAGMEVLSHRHVPPNDGGIALGQAAMALFKIRSQ
ncbi:MAG: carbamoyltransferase HypF [Thermoleophilia bacterium]|jgi:hydrogenase maturation protein HypF